MYTIHVDVATTRRKRLHHVLDDHDEPVWSGQRFGAALEYLREIGQTTFEVEGPTSDESFVLQFKTE